MGAICRGFRLARASWSVVMQERQLLWLPILSFLASLVVFAVFALGIYGIGLPESEDDIGVGFYILGFVLYVALSFVTIFFNAAVIGAATERLEGREASLSIGLGLARAPSRTDLRVGRDHRHGGDAPSSDPGARRHPRTDARRTPRHRLERDHVLRRPRAALRARHRARGDRTVGVALQARWGEQFTGNATIGLAIFLVALVVAHPARRSSRPRPRSSASRCSCSRSALVAAAGAACSGVFNAALYRYATTGEGAEPFSREDLDAAFKPKRGAVDTRPPMPPRPDPPLA